MKQFFKKWRVDITSFIAHVAFIAICAALLSSGHFGWAVFLIVIGLSYEYEQMFKRVNSELTWITGALTDDVKHKDLQVEKFLYHLTVYGHIEIKKGMSIQEFNKVLLQKLKKQDIDMSTSLSSIASNLEWFSNRSITNTEEDERIKNTTFSYHDYGAKIPTPVVEFKFKNWELVEAIAGSRSLI